MASIFGTKPAAAAAVANNRFQARMHAHTRTHTLARTHARSLMCAGEGD